MQKLKGSRLTYRITVSHNGKRYTTTYHPTAGTAAQIGAEVRREADRYEQEVRQGVTAKSSQTLADFLPQWRAQAEKELTPSQMEQYTAVLSHDICPLIGHIRLVDLQTADVQRVIDTLLKRGLKPATVRKYMCAVSSVIRYALDMGIINTDPTARTRYPRQEQAQRKHAWTPEQCVSFLSFVHDGYARTDSAGRTYKQKTEYKWYVFFLLSIVGSFRRGEIVALQWDDINRDACTVTVRRSAAKVKGKVYLKEPKTAAGIRTISLPAYVLDAVYNLPRISEYVITRGGTVDPGARLYPTSPSKQFRHLLAAYNRIHKKAPLPVISLHDLRHTGITILLEHGVGIETVKRRAGHSRASVTLDVYGESYDRTDRQAAETLQRVLMGGNGTDDKGR